MVETLRRLARGMLRNVGVRLDPRRRHPVVVSPLKPQPEPPGLGALKAELGQQWPMTGLLDILKEADLCVGFTNAFTTTAAHDATDRGEGYKELLHTRRRYVDTDALRDATRRIVNTTLAARHPRVWGEGTTTCASDSKHFGAFDQNLITEWHARYGRRGIMIYWHVERGSVCIHSRLQHCSSSEVAAMIEDVPRHDTEMQVERQYVDSHGQSEVAFAFCRLLGFQLLPRLKAIAAAPPAPVVPRLRQHAHAPARAGRTCLAGAHD